MLINLAVIVFRKSKIDSYDPGYRSPLYPWMQVAGIFISFMLIIYMGWTAVLFSLFIVVISFAWYYYYAREKVKREGAIFHWFALLGKHQYADIESEFMEILKEKGLRRGDPFDETVMRARISRFNDLVNFEHVVEHVASVYAVEQHVSEKELAGEFYSISPIEPALIIPEVSILYAKDEGVDHPSLHIVLVDGRGVRKPVSKGAISSEDYIRIMFFLVNPTSEARQQLRMLSRLIDIVERENFVPDFLGLGNERQAKEFLLHNERYVSVQLSENTVQFDMVGKKLMEISFPSDVLVAIVERDGTTITPKGNTELMENDILTIIGEPKSIAQIIKKYLKG
ncbi:MAG: PTS sugar transporter subunit IIA [Prolixibacteraceae bacterium]|jgi:APA family basic amino acid/polyamine antiporter|nr:PTS sugar transporter subunit IIA [Prolixibacteraceae bacterium]